MGLENGDRNENTMKRYTSIMADAVRVAQRWGCAVKAYIEMRGRSIGTSPTSPLNDPPKNPVNILIPKYSPNQSTATVSLHYIYLTFGQSN
jgi:hypothetical protein